MLPKSVKYPQSAVLLMQRSRYNLTVWDFARVDVRMGAFSIAIINARPISEAFRG